MFFSNFLQGYTMIRFIFGILLFSNIIRVLCIVASSIVSIMYYCVGKKVNIIIIVK